MSFMHNVAAQKTNEILQLIDSVNESVQIEEIEQKIVLLLLKDEEYNQLGLILQFFYSLIIHIDFKIKRILT